MVDPVVFEFGNIKRIVPLPTVRIDDAVRDHFALDDRRQSCTRGIGNDLGVNFSTPLKKTKYRDFPCRTPSTFTFTLAAEIALIHLDFPTKHSLALSIKLKHDNLAQTVKEICRSVAMNSYQTRSCSCGRSCNKMLKKTILLNLTYP